jgi:predicted permease
MLLLLSYIQQAGIISISNTALQVIIFQVGMPGMIVISILAKEMGYDEHRAITNIFVSTVFSLLSLQFLFYLMNKYFIL